MADQDLLAGTLARHYRSLGRTYPSEHLVRMILGSYPRLTLSDLLPEHVKVCEVGLGDGRNLALFEDHGWTVAGCEITDEIVARANARHPDADIRVGFSDQLPFGDDAFDLLVAWNTLYYLRDQPVERHVDEYARVLRTEGVLLASVPMPTTSASRTTIG